MSVANPIYTEITECTDCNKCIRECPVKGIKVKSGHAFIEPELCILCGHCAKVCPRGAKKVRNDLHIAKNLLINNTNVIASVAPSFTSEFPNISFEQLNTALIQLGFSRAEETAIGAQIVTRFIESNISNSKKINISSACPVIVNYIKKYRPEYANSIMNIDSPLLAHCKKIKSDENCIVVFIGPCIAKKIESDLNPEILKTVITFKDLKEWLDNENIIISELSKTPVIKRATNGSFYPIEGGMIRSFVNNQLTNSKNFSYSGISSIINGLDGVDINSNVFNGSFFELLACDGGCINGPGASCSSRTTIKTMNVLKNASNIKEKNSKDIDIDNKWEIKPIESKKFSDIEIGIIMKSIGKVDSKDEINCGACGYSTCKEFALAMLEGKAETNMCLNYLRKLSEKKANALIHTMPSGVIMVDNNLKIIESNAAFAQLMGEDCYIIHGVNKGLHGASLKNILHQYKSFQLCLDSGKSSESIIRVKDKIIKCIVYPVVDYLVVGGIFRDITEPRIQREKIISKAQEVLSKNVSTVQQIAYLLGENAADSEVMLNSIIKSFGKIEDDESGL